MGFFNKLFGFRWSLYLAQNENQLVYAMHENSVMRMIGFTMRYFADGRRPVKPWDLYLNFNHKHQKIKLGPEHFTLNGEDVSPLLIKQIASIDPDWQVKGGEPVFEEVATRKRLKISEHSLGNYDIKAMLANIDKPKELTFYRIMDSIFGVANNQSS